MPRNIGSLLFFHSLEYFKKKKKGIVVRVTFEWFQRIPCELTAEGKKYFESGKFIQETKIIFLNGVVDILNVALF